MQKKRDKVEKKWAYDAGCDPYKCEGNISAYYLEINQYEIIVRKTSPQLLAKKMKNGNNFIPHLIAVEKFEKKAEEQDSK